MVMGLIFYVHELSIKFGGQAHLHILKFISHGLLHAFSERDKSGFDSSVHLCSKGEDVSSGSCQTRIDYPDQSLPC